MTIIPKTLRKFYAALFCILLVIEVGIALFVRDAFIRPYVGDMLVTVLICCFIRIFLPTKVRALPLYVFAFAAAVETGQYFDFVQLIGLADNRFFSILLGRTFSAADLVCYTAGCLAFFLLESAIRRNT